MSKSPSGSLKLIKSLGRSFSSEMTIGQPMSMKSGEEMASAFINEMEGLNGKDLLDDVLLVRKTPKFDRLKSSPLLENAYVKDVLMNNW